MSSHQESNLGPLAPKAAHQPHVPSLLLKSFSQWNSDASVLFLLQLLLKYQITVDGSKQTTSNMGFIVSTTMQKAGKHWPISWIKTIWWVHIKQEFLSIVGFLCTFFTNSSKNHFGCISRWWKGCDLFYGYILYICIYVAHVRSICKHVQSVHVFVIVIVLTVVSICTLRMGDSAWKLSRKIKL